MAVANPVPNQKWQTDCQNGRPGAPSAKMAANSKCCAKRHCQIGTANTVPQKIIFPLIFFS